MQVGVGNIVSVRPFLSNDFDFILKLFWHSWPTIASENTQTATIKAQTTKEGCVKNNGLEKRRLTSATEATVFRSFQALALSLSPPKNVMQMQSFACRLRNCEFRRKDEEDKMGKKTKRGTADQSAGNTTV